MSDNVTIKKCCWLCEHFWARDYESGQCLRATDDRPIVFASSCCDFFIFNKDLVSDEESPHE